jgi:hypothetical protein
MRIVAIAILLSASDVAQVTARVVGVASQGSTVRASIEIVNSTQIRRCKDEPPRWGPTSGQACATAGSGQFSSMLSAFGDGGGEWVD